MRSAVTSGGKSAFAKILTSYYDEWLVQDGKKAETDP